MQCLELSHIAAVVLETVSDLTHVDSRELTLESNLADIGLDSLALIALIPHLHASVGISCTDAEAIELLGSVTLRDVVNWAESQAMLIAQDTTADRRI
jgi:acyl carrier protein